jgi:ABC-type branched-subunit amino acid transport system ATPase component
VSVESTPTRDAPLLLVDSVVAGYVPTLPIVHGVSLQVAPREVVTIIGPNGAGKSTILKAIVGLLKVTGGRVRLATRDITGFAPHAVIAQGIGFVPQTANVFTSLSIHENLVVGGHLLRSELPMRLERAYALFPILADKRRDRARTLSGGQRQMLAVARALMTDPRLVILDEPTAGLAPNIVDEVFERLRGLAQSGVAVLMVEQNARAALRVSDRAYVLAEGRNKVDGPAQRLLDDADVAAAFLGGRSMRQIPKAVQ